MSSAKTQGQSALTAKPLPSSISCSSDWDAQRLLNMSNPPVMFRLM